MNCDAHKERFSEYLDGRLDAQAAAGLERHLAACPRCARDLADLRAVVAALRAMPRQPVPEGFVSRVRARVAPLAARRAPVWRWVAASAAAAVLALAAVAVFGPHYGTRRQLARPAKETHVTTSVAESKVSPPRDEKAASAPERAIPHRKAAVAQDKRRDVFARPPEMAPVPAPPRTGGGDLPAPKGRAVDSDTLVERPRLEKQPLLPAPAAGRATADKEEVAHSIDRAKRVAAGAPPDGREVGEGGTAAPLATAPAAPTAAAAQPSGEEKPVAPPKPEAAKTPTADKITVVLGASDALSHRQHPSAWCVLTLRKPQVARGQPDDLRVLVRSRLPARNVSLRVQEWPPSLKTGPLLSLKPSGGEPQPAPRQVWRAPTMAAEATADVSLMWVCQWESYQRRGAPAYGGLGSAPGSAVYRLILSGDNLPSCRHLLLVPPRRLAAPGVAPPGQAVDVLRALTAQTGIYLLVPERVASAPHIALTPMPPQQALASALATLGLEVHKEPAAWTAR